ncbi:MAG: hypothetical protein OH338_03845 [Candidatus Parvarchaeota archaeon]|nr:hypothetical protein [Candidatus Parvarchaeota archaeon]MCW1294954.1 hypothetical protein [Candidatus Parvarchaeum tengchongense]MCW1295442.1 hypothetical protein [Candidatus Parvarchaeum tengchongense]MCW1299248.1 hypothetical protein [Candidatus Parvarchaeum tengchongense]MCW1312531.1 hypothetical protein [Candidatus Parvarchaeum tengchongense]
MQKINGWEVFVSLLKQNKFFTAIPVVIFSAYVYLFMHDKVGISAFFSFYPLFDIVSAFFLSFMISFIIAINYYIIKARKNANKRNTAWAIFFSLLSTPFCCNVLIPLFIAFIFGSAALSPVYDTAQILLVDYDPLIIAVSIVIIYIFYQRSLNAFLGCKIKLYINKNQRSLN